MADWHEADGEHEPWPVKFPAKTPSHPARARVREARQGRAAGWQRVDRADTDEVRKRLLGLLLAVEIGVVLATVCVLLLIFLN
jgi:hypothetical protein